MLTLALDIYASIFNKILEATDPVPGRRANSARQADAARWKAAKQTLTWKAYQAIQVAPQVDFPTFAERQVMKGQVVNFLTDNDSAFASLDLSAEKLDECDFSAHFWDDLKYW